MKLCQHCLVFILFMASADCSGYVFQPNLMIFTQDALACLTGYVTGQTTAFVPGLQKLPEGIAAKQAARKPAAANKAPAKKRRKAGMPHMLASVSGRCRRMPLCAGALLFRALCIAH